jgi:hypothetical protein
MLEMKKAYRTEGVLGTLRDQRPHQCNLDDLLRMEALPQGETLGVCYRDLPGVVTNPDREFWHAGRVYGCAGWCALSELTVTPCMPG